MKLFHSRLIPLQFLTKNKYSIDDTLTFPDLLKNSEESDNYEDIS